MNEIKEEILKIVKWISDREISDLSGDAMSRAITRLAVLRVNLGQQYAQAIADYDLSYIDRKISYAKQWNKFKKSVGKKISIAETDNKTLDKIADKMKKEIENKKYAEDLKILYQSTDKLISTLQTRLKVLESERRESRTQL